MDRNCLEPFEREEGTICVIGNVLEGKWCDGVFKFESDRVYVIGDGYDLSWILDGVIVQVERDVSDFVESGGMDGFNFWPVGVWYVWGLRGTGVG